MSEERLIFLGNLTDIYDIQMTYKKIIKVTIHHNIFPRDTDLHIKHSPCDLLISALLCFILSISKVNTEVEWKTNL